ncbi:hypothetical protein E2C01_043252 [Portunus trituberculatus]|uniref:Uncharacterized protein n=1 Tax=Portunus trituberculatus TaxID=210409 RepID=A0A5B7FNZ3_PORTR|nr:hypothetical protein [Portunus trituberculatus]
MNEREIRREKQMKDKRMAKKKTGREEHLTPEGQEAAAIEAPGEDWIPVAGAVVVSEKKEHILTSHQVAEDRRETEEVVHLGNVTNQDFVSGPEGL